MRILVIFEAEQHQPNLAINGLISAVTDLLGVPGLKHCQIDIFCFGGQLANNIKTPCFPFTPQRIMIGTIDQSTRAPGQSEGDCSTLDITEEQLVAGVLELDRRYDIYICLGNALGRSFLARLAGCLSCDMISAVRKIDSEGILTRAAYTVQFLQNNLVQNFPVCISIHPTAYQPRTTHSDEPDTNIEVDSEVIRVTIPTVLPFHSCWVKEPSADFKREVNLTNAKIVLAGGRGIGSRENFEKLSKYADAIGAALGASRAAIEADYIETAYQIGQSSRTVAPNLYLALGISGAPQHMGGIGANAIIVAVNTDPQAPIMEMAHYALCMDWQEFIEEFTANFKSNNGLKDIFLAS